MAMIRGLAVPVGVDATGRAKIAGGDDQLIKIIGLRMSSMDSENPFQEYHHRQPIFDVNDHRLRMAISHHLRDLFQAFQAAERARLKENSVNFSHHENGDLILSFSYFNMETDKELDYQSAIHLVSGRLVVR